MAHDESTSLSKRRNTTHKSYDPHGLGPIEKTNRDENGQIIDIVKSSHKIGIMDDPIPFSYVIGKEGRNKPQKGARAKPDREPL